MAIKRLGNQNPTQSLILPYKKSRYRAAIDLYEQSKRTAQQWQVDLIKHIYAINKDGLYVHTKFGYSLPRRNGKNEVICIREMQGLQDGEQILHTAHRTTTSHTAWERLCKLLDAAGIAYNSLRATGRERIDLPDTGGRIEFRTRTTTGGLGEGFDLLVIDEAQEYTEDQESTLKYVVSDSKNPQTIMCGTPPTPLSSGTVFTGLRNSTIQGSSGNSGWAEWSVEEESDIQNRELWYMTNPSLGTILTERAIADEIGSDTIDFNIQRLGLWLRYNQKSAISETEWSALQVRLVPELEGKLSVGIKYGNDGTNVAMSIAARTSDERIFVEAIDCRPIRNGNDWILTFLSVADVNSVAIDGARGQMLAPEIKDARIKKKLIYPTVKEIILANAAFEQGVFDQALCHKGQPSLAKVASNCDKRAIGTNGGFGYRSQFEEYDIALLDSAMLAYWACSESKTNAIKQRIGY